MALPQSNEKLPPMRMCFSGTTAQHTVNVNNAKQNMSNNGPSVAAIKQLQNITLQYYFPITEPGIKDEPIMSSEYNVKIC